MEGKPKGKPFPPRPPEFRAPRPPVRPPSGIPPNPGIVPPPGMAPALRDAALRQQRQDAFPSVPKKKKNTSVPAGQIEGKKIGTFTNVDAGSMDVIQADK